MSGSKGRGFALGMVVLCVLALPLLAACGNDGDEASPAAPGGMAQENLEWGKANWGDALWTTK